MKGINIVLAYKTPLIAVSPLMFDGGRLRVGVRVDVAIILHILTLFAFVY